MSVSLSNHDASGIDGFPGHLVVLGLAGGRGDNPLVVELWPGKVPDETGNIVAEKFLMSPKLDCKQVEVTEPTKMVTNVTKPTTRSIGRRRTRTPGKRC